ncbi:MAG: hypothetical protein WA705_01290 [Candidatus Ozemobacteraceae bacterium]
MKNNTFCLFLILLCSLFSSNVFGQTSSASSSSFSSAAAADGIRISGAVRQEKTFSGAELEAFPARFERVKIPNASQAYGGTFEADGIELAGVLKACDIEKKRNDGFDRELDMYVRVIGRDGGTAVFSWGELFLGDAANGILLVKQLRFLYPHKHADFSKLAWKPEEWFSRNGEAVASAQKAACASCHNGTLNPVLVFPRSWCIVASRDGWPGRFVEDVVEIQVCQVPADQIPVIASQPRETMWVEKPSLILPDGSKSEIAPDSFKDLPRFSQRGCSFGLGKGFHGIHDRNSYDLAMVLGKRLEKYDLNQAVILVSCPDGYRGLFSGAEVFRSRNSGNVLMIDAEDGQPMKPGDGKFKIFSNGDFYIDRSLRSVAEIRCFLPGKPDTKE